MFELLKELKIRHRRCSVKIGILKNFRNFTGKKLCWSLSLIKLQAWRSAILFKRDSNRCFPVKVAKFLRTPFLKNICERLFLNSPLPTPYRKRDSQNVFKYMLWLNLTLKPWFWFCWNKLVQPKSLLLNVHLTIIERLVWLIYWYC